MNRGVQITATKRQRADGENVQAAQSVAQCLKRVFVSPGVWITGRIGKPSAFGNSAKGVVGAVDEHLSSRQADAQTDNLMMRKHCLVVNIIGGFASCNI